VKEIIVPYIKRPPIIDITIAGTTMIPECANKAGRAIPITTKKPVRNLPKSSTPFPDPSIKSSGLEHRAQTAFGSGARIYVATTKRG